MGPRTWENKMNLTQDDIDCTACAGTGRQLERQMTIASVVAGGWPRGLGRCRGGRLDGRLCGAWITEAWTATPFALCMTCDARERQVIAADPPYWMGLDLAYHLAKAAGDLVAASLLGRRP